MTANGEGMRTENAAPSLQAEEAVAATDQEIAACPFCGSPGRIYHDAQNGVFSVDCSRSWTEDDREDCCSMALVKSLSEAVAAWNSRSDAATIATLRKALGEAAERIEEMAPSICDDCQTTDYGCGLMLARGDGYCCKRCVHALVAKLRSAALDEKEG